jgi:hypothetical protein
MHLRFDSPERYETHEIQDMVSVLNEEHRFFQGIRSQQLVQGISLDSSASMFTKISQLLPSLGVNNQYRSEFEREVAVLLRLLGMNANKYQGQFADRCKKSTIMKFFENNPDIIIMNGMKIPVECKSTGEWKEPLSVSKSVPKEIIIYQKYLPEIGANSVILIYEGSVSDSKSFNSLKEILEDNANVLFVTKNFLLSCLHKPILRQNIMKRMSRPTIFPSEERILRQ